MARDVTIKIKAEDSASATFKKIGTESKAMGTQVTTSADQSARSLETMQKRTMAVGAAVGTLIGGMSLAGTAFVNQETQIRGLTRAYGDSTDTILKFSEELQRNTVYSNDAARQSAIYASSLIQNYGLTADQIAVVIQRSADLAAVNVTAQGTQIELTDAVARTSAALRGEAEAGELLGLSMSDTFLKAEALKRGIQGWGTSMTEAEKAQFRLTIMLEQSSYAMGAAAQEADTAAGKAKQFKNQVQDLTQEFGGALGPMGEYLSVMGNIALAAPLAGAAIGKLGAGLAALGVRPGMLGPAALIGGAGLLAYGYSQDTLGTTQINTLANQFFMAMGGVLNQLLPGNPYDTSKYSTQMDTNAQWSTINSLLQAPGMSQDATVQRLANLLGVQGTMQTAWIDPATGQKYYGEPPPSAPSSSMYVPPTEDEILAAAVMGASVAGIPLATYLLNEIKRDPSLTQDPLTGSYVTWRELSDYQFARGGRRDAYGGWQPGVYPAAAVPLADQLGTSRYYGDITSAAYTGPFQPRARTGISGATTPPTYLSPEDQIWREGIAFSTGFRDRGSGYGVTSGPFSDTGVESGIGGGMDLGGGLAESVTAAILEQQQAYYGLATAQQVAREGASLFKATQDSLLESQGVYNHQLSEFGSQQSALTAGYDLLLERQEEGIALSEEEQALLDNYPALYERITGAVDDATISNALIAAQYIENMRKSDEYKESVDAQTESIGDLITIIEDFILSLDGVPDEVTTRIELNRAEEARASLQAVVDLLNSLDGRSATFYVDARGTGVSLGSPSGVGITPDMMDGGTVYAANGFTSGGNWAIVGERGPEGVWLPNGAQVMNTEGSRSRLGGGGDTFKINTVNIYDPNPRQIGQAIREAAVGSSRA